MLSITDWAGDTLEVAMYVPPSVGEGTTRPMVEVVIHPEAERIARGAESRIVWLDTTQAREVAAALLERAAELEGDTPAAGTSRCAVCHRDAHRAGWQGHYYEPPAATPMLDLAAQLADHTAAACKIIEGGQ